MVVEPEPEPEPDPEPEPEPEPEANAPWSSLLNMLALGDDENLAEVGKAEDDETVQLRVKVLDAEQEEDKAEAMAQLIAHKEAKKDEQHEAAVAVLTEQIAAKDAAIEQLKAKLGGSA